jgi:uncharacterized protein (DUF58 family)
MRIVRSLFVVLALVFFATSFAPSFVQAQVGKLEINKATYGREGQGKDVTHRVRNQIKNNSIDMKVNNDTMGGDPNQGTEKTLKVDYTYRGQHQHIVVKEGDRLKLP